MELGEKILVVYLIGLVFWITMVYVGMKGKEDVKNFDLMALTIGVLWFFFVPYNILKIVLERRQKK